MPLRITSGKDGIQFSAAVRPRSSKNEISGLHGDMLKIRLTSPPVDGEANKCCIRFLAEALDIGPSRVSIVSGLSGRRKTIRIEAMSREEFLKKIGVYGVKGG